MKKNFVLRIDSDNYKALEKWAADEFRSVNAQMEYLLDRALKENRKKEVKNEPGLCGVDPLWVEHEKIEHPPTKNPGIKDEGMHS